MDAHKLDRSVSDDRVNLWEWLGVTLGGLGLIGVALVGLGRQFWRNMQDPARAELIARQIIQYKIPGGSQGVISLHIGAEAFALVTSRQSPPKIMLLVTQSPLKQGEENESFADELDLQGSVMGAWQTVTVTQQEQVVCGQRRPVIVRTGDYWVQGQSTAQPAVEYVIQQVVHQTERKVQLVTTGPDAAAQAEQVLRSLRCRPQAKFAASWPQDLARVPESDDAHPDAGGIVRLTPTTPGPWFL
jgi:hypothetical protein